MSAAKHTVLLLWLAIVATLAHVPDASGFTTENRVWKIFGSASETRPAIAAHLPQPHQENAFAAYDFAPGCCLAAKGIATPHGLALQADTAAARAALGEVQSGSTIYRQGSFGVQNTADAQFWSLQNPATTSGFANKLGMPGSAAKPDWIMGGTVSPSSPVITRPAPGIGANVGGNMEAVVPPNGVGNLWFHMPD